MISTTLSTLSLVGFAPLLADTAAETVASPFALWRTVGLLVLLVFFLIERFIAKRRAADGKVFRFGWLRTAFFALLGIIVLGVVFKDLGLAAPMLPGYIWQNIIAVLVSVPLLFGLLLVLLHPFWGRRTLSILKNPFVLLSVLLVFFFAGTALLDSISWKDAHNKEEAKQVALEAQEPRSILDRLFASAVGMDEWEYNDEVSHSAPLAKHQFNKPDVALKNTHLMGTTIDGRDTLYQVLKGCKPAVVVGTLPLIISIPLALFFGVIGGYYGGKIDDFVVYIYSTLASIPSLLLLFAIIIAFGTGIFQVCIALGVAGWVGLCRLSRAETLKLRELEYVQAAKCLGVSNAKILTRHIIPNLMHIVIITAILAFTGLVLSEAVLSYLGVGLDNSWGGLINNARDEISRQPTIWWNLAFASAALFLLVLAVNVIGDALRDALDPRVSVGH